MKLPINKSALDMQIDWIGISLLLGGFLSLMLLRVPIAFALGLSSLVTAAYL